MGSGSSSLPPPPSTLPLIIEEFFIVVYEDPLVKKELPKKFADYLDGKEPAKVYLRAADCGPRLWTVEVLFDGQGRMYLDKGWEKFAIAHGVDFGWFVHFKYEGDDVLTVKVFDGTMCRRAAPSPTSSKPWCSSSSGVRVILELRPLASSSGPRPSLGSGRRQERPSRSSSSSTPTRSPLLTPATRPSLLLRAACLVPKPQAQYRARVLPPPLSARVCDARDVAHVAAVSFILRPSHRLQPPAQAQDADAIRPSSPELRP
ncbi:hypothetical protein QYE76_043212 [Lolium multiflorum]|uniref:TF-B3 domain-containing protein n=1 Tax=Lolium multiflorum TaxID=4521 RepID=A0AAD8TII8_LOLMU|nr:hypothetical protein QYE76_043212 [Lolium multiflorum]